MSHREIFASPLWLTDVNLDGHSAVYPWDDYRAGKGVDNQAGWSFLASGAP